MKGAIKKVVLDATALTRLIGYLTGTEELGTGARVVGGDVRCRSGLIAGIEVRLVVSRNEFPVVDGDPPRIEVGELDWEKAEELKQAIKSRREGTEEVIRELVRSEIERTERGGTEATRTETSVVDPPGTEETEGAAAGGEGTTGTRGTEGVRVDPASGTD